MNDFLEQIRKRSGITEERRRLDENAKKRYLQMFQDILNSQFANENTKNFISGQIESARNILKRDDRIVWYLKIFKVGYLQSLASNLERGGGDKGQEAASAVRQNLDKYVSKLANKMNATSDQIMSYGRSYNNILRDMDHYFSYQLPQIENIVFQYQTPDELETIMSQAEDEWRDNQERSIPPTEDAYDDAEVVIDFGDGFAWWNLNVDACSKEGAAMGHCGNQQQRNGDESILSLRQRVVRGKEEFDIPYLTFILDGNGYLGEMKGRGNVKPAERYHPYIIELLKQPIIKGIKGGGHAPEENFSINDLDENTRDKLIKENPALEGLYDKYKRLGNTEEVINTAMEFASAHNMQPYGFEFINSSQVVVKIWRNVKEYARDLGDIELENAYDAWDSGGLDENVLQKFEPSQENIADVLYELPDRSLKKILDKLGLPMIDRSDFNTRTRILKKAGEKMRSDRELYDDMKEAIVWSASGGMVDLANHDGQTPDMFDQDKRVVGASGGLGSFYDYISELIHSIEFKNYDHDISWGGESKKDLNAQVKFIIDFSDFIGTIDAAVSGDEYMDDDLSQYAYYIRAHNGDWAITRDFDVFENRREWRREGNDSGELLRTFGRFFNPDQKQGTIEFGNISDGGFDAREAAKVFLDLTESENTDTDFDTLIEDIRRRAGVA